MGEFASASNGIVGTSAPLHLVDNAPDEKLVDGAHGRFDSEPVAILRDDQHRLLGRFVLIRSARLLAMIARGSTRLFERASDLCANLTCIQCGALQLGLKVLDLNTEGFLKILGAQKLLPEVSVGCNLPLNVFLEGAYLLLIGAWKASHGPLDHIKVALRSGSHLFEIFKHRGSNGFERVFFGCHVTLPASYAIWRHRTVGVG